MVPDRLSESIKLYGEFDQDDGKAFHRQIALNEDIF